MRSVFSPKMFKFVVFSRNCCWLLTAAVRLCIVCLVSSAPLKSLACDVCSVQTLSLCVCIRPTFLILKLMLILNFPSGMLITSTALLYFSWTAIFSPQFEPSLLKLNSGSHAVANFWTIFSLLRFPACMFNDIFAKFTQFGLCQSTSISLCIRRTHMPRFPIPMVVCE